MRSRPLLAYGLQRHHAAAELPCCCQLSSGVKALCCLYCPDFAAAPSTHQLQAEDLRVWLQSVQSMRVYPDLVGCCYKMINGGLLIRGLCGCGIPDLCVLNWSRTARVATSWAIQP